MGICLRSHSWSGRHIPWQQSSGRCLSQCGVNSVPKYFILPIGGDYINSGCSNPKIEYPVECSLRQPDVHHFPAFGHVFLEYRQESHTWKPKFAARTQPVLFWDVMSASWTGLNESAIVLTRFWNVILQPRHKHQGSTTFCGGNTDIVGYYITPL